MVLWESTDGKDLRQLHDVGDLKLFQLQVKRRVARRTRRQAGQNSQVTVAGRLQLRKHPGLLLGIEISESRRPMRLRGRKCSFIFDRVLIKSQITYNG